jgi:hypothetical protein
VLKPRGAFGAFSARSRRVLPAAQVATADGKQVVTDRALRRALGLYVDVVRVS